MIYYVVVYDNDQNIIVIYMKVEYKRNENILDRWREEKRKEKREKKKKIMNE
jgi:hypothetical protein